MIITIIVYSLILILNLVIISRILVAVKNNSDPIRAILPVPIVKRLNNSKINDQILSKG